MCKFFVLKVLAFSVSSGDPLEGFGLRMGRPWSGPRKPRQGSLKGTRTCVSLLAGGVEESLSLIERHFHLKRVNLFDLCGNIGIS